MTPTTIVALALLLGPLAASAGTPAVADLGAEPAAFAAQRARIEADLAGGERYREITDRQRADVLDGLRTIATLLDAGGLDALSHEQKITLFNAQEQVNTILTRAAEDSRLVCRREQKVGSHRQTTICRTVAERRLAREQSQEYWYSQSKFPPLPKEQNLRGLPPTRGLD